MKEYHAYTDKKPGDRVKIPMHPASPECGYYYGTVIEYHRRLLVKWDRPPKYLAKVTELLPAISCISNEQSSLTPHVQGDTAS